MGVQIVIEASEMLRAGASITSRVDFEDVYDELGRLVYERDSRPCWTIQGVFKDFMSYHPEAFMVDFNSGGNIRPQLEPWLEANQVKYRLV